MNNSQTTTIFPDKPTAEKLRDAIQIVDLDWQYVVRRFRNGYVIRIFDEDRHYVGNL